jgi:hypothetical protein
MNKRARLTAAQYIETPPDLRDAMGTVNAIALYQDFVHRNLPAPEEVKIEAIRQLNENTPEGWVTLPEEYHGRLRIRQTKKGRRG